MIIETIKNLSFSNGQGLRLYGMLHMPAAAAIRNTGIVLLSPGIKTRVGPHQQYVRMARKFASMGFPVLRFDFCGLGDSEGELTEHMHADLHTEIQLGRYVDDSKCAIDCIIRDTGVEKVILAGLCGGAVTGLLAGIDDNRVAGLLALGIPVILDNQVSDADAAVTGQQLDRLKQGYIRKLADPKAWLRLLTLKSDFKTLMKSFRHKKEGPTGAPQPAAKDSGGEAPNNLNHLFGPACFSFLERNAKILFVFSGGDRLYWEFEEKFAKPNREKLAALQANYRIHVVQEANHILTMPEWEQEMLDVAESWLKQFLETGHRQEESHGAKGEENSSASESVSPGQSA